MNTCAAITVSSDRGRKACNKGKKGEREFCRRVAALTDQRIQLQRHLSQCRDSGDDTGYGRFSIEIKRWKSVSDALVRDWWCQCQRNATAQHKVPVLAFRADQQTWQVMMHPNHFFAEHDVRGCLRMDIELFCKVLEDPQLLFGTVDHGTPA